MNKDADGNIVMKENFWLRYFWGTNLIKFIESLLFKISSPFEPNYPRNRCTLFWGFILAPVLWIIVLVLGSIVLGLLAIGYFCFAIVYFFTTLVIFPFGFVLVCPWRRKKYILYHNYMPFQFHPYRRYGLNDEKKFPALWWLWLPALLIWPFRGEYFYVLKGAVNFIIPFLFNTTTLIFLGVVVVILLIIRYRKFFFEKIKEIKKKTCLPIVVIKKEK